MDGKELMKQAFNYQGALVSYAYGLSQDWSLAEDAVQDAFLVLLEKADQYDPNYGVFPWLKKMVYFKVQEHVRKRNRNLPVQDEELSALVHKALDDYMDEDHAVVYRYRQGALMHCMELLQGRARQLIGGFYWSDRSADDLGNELGMTSQAVWTQLCRIRKRLRRCVELRLASDGGM